MNGIRNHQPVRRSYKASTDFLNSDSPSVPGARIALQPGMQRILTIETNLGANTEFSHVQKSVCSGNNACATRTSISIN